MDFDTLISPDFKRNLIVHCLAGATADRARAHRRRRLHDTCDLSNVSMREMAAADAFFGRFLKK